MSMVATAKIQRNENTYIMVYIDRIHGIIDRNHMMVKPVTDSISEIDFMYVGFRGARRKQNYSDIDRETGCTTRRRRVTNTR